MSIGSSAKVNKQESPRLRTARHRSWFLGARKGERGTARYHTKTHLAPPLQTGNFFMLFPSTHFGAKKGDASVNEEAETAL